MNRHNIMIRNCAILFILGLGAGLSIGLSFKKETIIVRQGVADTPAALSSVNLMLDYGTGTIRTWNTVTAHEGMSVLNLVETVAATNAFTMLTKDIGNGFASVDSIDGIHNDSKTHMRWQYWVNNVYEPRGANKYFLKPGDIVVWKYVAEQPK